MPKKFVYKGKNVEELQNMNFEDLILLFTSRERRHLKRGIHDRNKR